MGLFDRPPSKEYFELNHRLTEIAVSHRERDDHLASQIKELTETNSREHKANAERIEALTQTVASRFADTDAKLANIAALTATNLGKLESQVSDIVKPLEAEFTKQIGIVHAEQEQVRKEYAQARFLAGFATVIQELFTNPKYRLILLMLGFLLAVIFGHAAFTDLINKI